MKSFLKTKDYTVSGEWFELLHNLERDMLVTIPQPADLSRYYESEAYISHTDGNRTLLEKGYQIVKRYSLNKKIRLISSVHTGEKNILDIGAGTGDFLLKAKSKGWSVTGIEPNAPARKKASQKGLDLLSDLAKLSHQKFDVITLWHVLEHLPNLEAQIKEIKSRLKPNGTLIIAVPNYKSYDARHYGMFWAAYDVPRHLWHFSKTAIQKLFGEQKIELVKIKPMIFDSFYVSLLSEKYKTGNQNFLRAFWVGLVSNLLAWRSKEYSSHIYILKKP